ncbi:hypothetical protein [Collimonas pratensis]|uniref:Lipoprotein n=1 Tax=Collimonas pratensis TaxID=279113 RepID=A0ABN4M973_9BURK|nr:hypothetical protein [Collimonas pratensis]AMP14216.1 hypothetical protein CPter291_1951 [Collimonas pratensis]
MLCFCATSFAGTLFQFSEDSLIALRSNDTIQGYFYEQTGTGLFQCSFFFQGKISGTQGEKDAKSPIKIFHTPSTYDKRLKELDDDGYLYFIDGDWVIQSKMASSDCHSVDANLFSATDSKGWPFSVEKKEQAYGIMTLKGKSTIFAQEKNRKVKDHLSAGEVVILLNSSGEMAHIKYKKPNDENGYTSGWIDRSNLISPLLLMISQIRSPDNFSIEYK